MSISHSSKNQSQWESRPIGFGLPRNRKKYRPEKKFKSVFKIILTLSVIFILSGAALAGGVVIWLSKDLPNPDTLLERYVPQSTKIYDRSGETILYEIHGDQSRTLVKLSDIPDYVKQATIAIEDKDFYKHKGVSLWGVMRGVAWQALRGRRIQGGSTLTQQFIKNAVLTSERTLQRKIKEWILAYKIEQKYSKDQILQMYLNEIPYGSTSYGIESASKMLFNKSAKDLTLSEAALLSALPQSPTYYSPYGSHADELESRQRYILSLMVEQGYITEEKAEEARNEDVLSKVAPQKTGLTAPHFVMYVKELLVEKYGQKLVEEGGLKVYTTLDMEKQRLAEEAVNEGAERNEAYGAYNAAMVALDPKTGQILAMVGGKDGQQSEPDGCTPGKNCVFEPYVNVVLRPRQPGSSFKPVVYATAFKKGYTPETILFDLVTNFGPQGPDKEDYIPHNYTNKEYGPVTMRKALSGSLNIPAVKTIYLTGINNVLDLADLMGYTTFKDRTRYGLSLVLGGGEVKLLEHVSAFGIFAAEGVRQPSVAILKIEDKDGNILEKFKENKGKRVLEEEIARQISSILSDNESRSFIFGEKNYLILPDRPVAAKTGTTNDFRDGWTIGYTPSLAAGVWVGNNNNKEMKTKADGGNVAAPIWNKFMSEALQGTPAENFTPPQPVEAGKPVLTGQMEGEYKVKIDRASGKLATDLTPASFVEEKSYKAVHNILHYVNKDDPRGPYPSDPKVDPQYEKWEEAVQRWIKEQGYATERPPAEYDDLHTLENKPQVTIVYPESNSVYTEAILKAEASVQAPREISRLEYSIDGRPIDTVIAKPFVFRCFSSDFENGYHNLTVRAYDDIDNFGETTIRFNLFAQGEQKTIYWLEPRNNSTIYSYGFPLNLAAIIPNPLKVNRVKFYYLDAENFQPFLIGMISKPQSPVVSLAWSPKPARGIYKLYVELIDKEENITRSDYLNVEVE